MGFFDKLLDDVIMAPVKVALLPLRVLCVAVDGKHMMGPWQKKNGRWVRRCDICSAEEEYS